MNHSRRLFLASLGGAPLVLGWERLVGQDRVASRPTTQAEPDDPFPRALARIAHQDAPGIGFVLPASAAERQALLDLLAYLVTGSSARAAGLFLRAVVVVAPRSRLPANEHDTVVLFDKTGARAGGITRGAAGGRDERRELLIALHALIDEFERERRRATKTKGPEPGQRELEQWLATDGSRPEHQTLFEVVARHCSPGSYALWYWRETTSPDVRSRCDSLIRAAFAQRIEARERLPFGLEYGTRIDTVPTGCGCSDDFDPRIGMPMVACGMGLLQVRSLELIERLRK